MKKPVLIFNIKDYIKKICNDKRAAKEAEIMIYMLKTKGFYESFDKDKCSITYEKVKDFGIEVHTRRYDGHLLFRRFPMGFDGLEYRYEIEE